jgi:hypothetical protein
MFVVRETSAIVGSLLFSKLYAHAQVAAISQK